MLPLHIQFLLSLSVIFAAITGIIKYRTMDGASRPMVLAWCLLVMNETVRFLLIKSGNYSLISYNIGFILLMLLYLWQFRKWRLLSQPFFLALASLFIIMWLLDYFILQGIKIHEKRNLFRIIASLGIVLLAISNINKLAVSEKNQLWRNHVFIICIGFVVYYTYRVIIDGLYIRGLGIPFQDTISLFNLYLLQLYYLLMFIAALWMPKKKRFILPSS